MQLELFDPDVDTTRYYEYVGWQLYGEMRSCLLYRLAWTHGGYVRYVLHTLLNDDTYEMYVP